MATDFGTGVSRTLSPLWRQFSAVVWQSDAPPLDSEFNLMSQVDWERLRTAVKTVMPSGFIMDPTRALNDYQFDSNWTNIFALGNPKSGEKYPVIWANVNGWLLPITGTNIDPNIDPDDLRNLIKLYPPPTSGSRLDFVFLEAWQTRIDPNPSTVNKPTASTIWKYGNTVYGGTNLPDDLEDPDIGYETTGRIQVQYRLRVVGSGVGVGSGVDLATFPDGLTDSGLPVLGQGTSTLPVPGFFWTNMREELGDPSLWRAGDGIPNNGLGTIDGYTYAIPVCAIFRRNSQAYLAAFNGGNPNQNGSFLRTPGNAFLPDPLVGDKLLTTITLVGDLSFTAQGAGLPGTVAVNNLSGSGLDDPHHVLPNTFLVIDDEIIGIDSINVGAGTIHIPTGGRGRYGSAAVGHAANAVVRFFNTRPDGLYADQIDETDILDLRRAVNPGDWDFHRLLEHNVAALAKGELRSAWKDSGAGGTEGVTVHEVDDLYAVDLTHPNQTEAVDGTDGIRTVFSDAAAIQPDVTVLCDNAATLSNGFTTQQFDITVSWDVGPDFHPKGFMNNGTTSPYPVPSPPSLSQAWTNGSTILMFIGGANGNLPFPTSFGARGTFRNGADRAVRFLMPKEYFKAHFPSPEMGNQNPIQLRFLNERAHEPGPPTPTSDPCLPIPLPNPLLARHAGPMYPWRDQDFERPFIALGGMLRPELRLASIAATALTTNLSTGQHEIDVGINFDLAEGYFSKDVNGNFDVEPLSSSTGLPISAPVLRDQRTLYGMLTDNGRDRTGASSEVYLVLYGDPASTNNNGAFKVIGAGQNPMTGGAGYTEYHASTSTGLVLEPLSADFTGFDSLTANNVAVEFRSPYHNSEDNSDLPALYADLAIVLTDIGGLTEHPWKREYLGYQAADGYDLSMPVVPDPPASPGDPQRAAVPSKLLIDLTLQYHPGRGALARVPDEIVRFSQRGVTNTNPASGAYLRQSPAIVDTTFATFSGAPSNESFYDLAQVQTWNRLPSVGLYAPLAPNYGGNTVGYTEIDREHELFFDRGSKTVIFRPFRDRQMTLKSMVFPQDPVVLPVVAILGSNCLLGPYQYPAAFAKDALPIFTGGAAAGKTMGLAVPREFMPRFGRQDIPYYADVNAGAGPFLSGINHLFRDSTTTNEPVFNIIGGYSNLGAAGVNPMYFLTGAVANYATDTTIGGPLFPAYFARNTTDIPSGPPGSDTQVIKDRLAAVHSSDLGGGLKGIQLPPYLGIARLYAVYQYDDFVANGSAFNGDRATLSGGGAKNLLREDAHQQTLFILQDGAKDLTLATCDHTYIIPSNTLDVTRIPTYVSGQKFEDFKYVVECTTFGFSRGWINENNYVLVRQYNGDGTLRVDTDNLELAGVHMVIPCPAEYGDDFYVAYNRTVYQGDPFMTRIGTGLTTSDYEFRLGQVPTSDQYELRTPLTQYDVDGNPVVEKPNARAFEILASMDFYTTLGTGKIGGAVFPGTSLDVGYTEQLGAHRMPPESDSPPWRILPRSYTDGQERNDIRAMLGLELKNDGASPITGNGGAGGDAIAGGPGARTLTITSGPFNPVRVGYLVGRYVTIADSTSATNDGTFLITGSTPNNVITYANPLGANELFPIGASYSINGLSPALNPSLGISGSGVPGDTLTGGVGANVLFIAAGPFNPAVLGPLVGRYVTITNAGGTNNGTFLITGNTPNTTITYNNPNAPVPPAPSFTGATYAIGGDHGYVRFTRLDGVNVDLYASAEWPPTSLMGTPFFIPADDIFRVVLNHFQTQYNMTTVDVSVPNILPNGIVSIVATVPDVFATDVITVNVDPAYPFTNVIAYASGANEITFVIFNGMGPYSAALETFKIAVFKNAGVPANLDETARNLATLVNGHAQLQGTVKAYTFESSRIDFEAVPVGAQGNGIRIAIRHTGELRIPPYLVQNAFRLLVPHDDIRAIRAYVTGSNMMGGRDIPVNAGNGTSPLAIVGMTERLPLGILLRDSDFLCENPLGDEASAMQTRPVGPRPIQTILPLIYGGEEYDRFLGSPGELVALADGDILTYIPGTKFRLYRGGGSAYVLSGQNPGGPVDWVSDSFAASIKPVLKGGVLVCRAMLVRNFYETAFAPQPYVRSDGDEIQMVVTTYGILGEPNTTQEGITLKGVISPTGYGEGYAAADRYRIHGKPMFLGQSRQVPDPADVTLAVYSTRQRE